jgi:sugar lactone lactonase YvrE
MQPERILDSGERLGECPLWEERTQTLWWVDIQAQEIKCFDGRDLTVRAMPEPVGSIALRADAGLLAAMQTGLYLLDTDQGNSAPTLLAAPHGKPADHRFNDGRCDRAGRFWVGTLKDPEFTPTGVLYRYDGAFTRHRQGIRVPNSLAWSPDGRVMYFADSPRHKIWAFDYDSDTGRLSHERVFATPHPGFPDGSCVDADGCLWNAEYGGGRVVRYTPQGRIDRVITLPPEAPTCCCFGGAQLDTLYITTANGAGMWALRPGVTGLPEARFRR